MSGLVEYFAQHLDYFFYSLAGVCLLMDLTVLGLNGPLLFMGIGSLFSGFFISLGMVSEFSVAMAIFAGFSVASAGILWKPLKKLQNKEAGPQTTSDMVGKVLPVSALVTKTEGRVSYSGVEWLARLDDSSSEPIAPSTQALVTSVDGTILVVRAASRTD